MCNCLEDLNLKVYLAPSVRDLYKTFAPATKGSTGIDLYSPKDVTLAPNERLLLPLGVYTSFKEGYSMLMSPKSGLALKKGLTLTNTPGLIDSDYRNEIGAILFNSSDSTIEIKKGSKVVQVWFVKNPLVVPTMVNDISGLDDNTDRSGGFGSTGV